MLKSVAGDKFMEDVAKGTETFMASIDTEVSEAGEPNNLVTK